jgi:glycogen(starch) synthase
MKPRHRSDSLASAISGTLTPSGGRKLSEKDLAKADAALSASVLANGDTNGNGVNGH